MHSTFSIWIPGQAPLIWSSGAPLAIPSLKAILYALPHADQPHEEKLTLTTDPRLTKKHERSEIQPLIPGQLQIIEFGQKTVRIKKLPPKKIHLQADCSTTPIQSFTLPIKKNHLKKWNLTTLATVSALGLVQFTLQLREAPPQNELIPAQYAKLILTPPKSLKPPSSATAAGAPGRAQGSQALQQKSVQRAVNRLLSQNLQKMAQSLSGPRTTLSITPGVGRTPGSIKNPLSGLTTGGTIGLAAAEQGGVGYGGNGTVGIAGQGRGMVNLDFGEAAVEEGLTKDEVGEVIHRHSAEIRYCYESALLRNPGLEGKLVTAFTIGPKGGVTTGSLKDSTLSDPRAEQCVLSRVLTWKFPTPKGGVSVPVTYPFVFKNLGS